MRCLPGQRRIFALASMAATAVALGESDRRRTPAGAGFPRVGLSGYAFRNSPMPRRVMHGDEQGAIVRGEASLWVTGAIGCRGGQ